MRRCSFVCFILITTSLYLYSFNSKNAVLPLSDNTKYVLYWTTMFTRKEFFGSSGSELFQNCECSNCYASSNRSILTSVDQYDAILFYVPSGVQNPEVPLPEVRSPKQRYVFVAQETPIRCYREPEEPKYSCVARYVYDNFYNWTMSYRFDSDITDRVDEVSASKAFKSNYELPIEEYVRKKDRMIAWFVSNCRSANRREQLARKISEYVPVDVYGKCGNLSCPRGRDCYEMAEQRYKFYLSFENSYCKDYTTEKLYNLLKYNIVPIVYGGGDYEAITPPHSVINVEDFESVKDLADYLKYLAQNEEEYLKYFEWKKHYVVKSSRHNAACKLCEMLNNPNQPVKVYEDIDYWWFNKSQSGCKADDELPKIAL